jgi:predicted DNA-binding transcriptional regulator YafY
MRASRIVSLLLLLQTRGSMTAGELARELEVSVRTIHRDVEALSAAGVPIYAERGRSGGIRLVEGYRTRLTGLTGDEAEALFMSGLPGPAAELGLGTVVATARLKVLASLPTELRGRASRLVERFHLDPAGWFQADEPAPHLAVLANSVWDSHRVAIDYDRGDRVTHRLIDPLGIVLKSGVWYVVARSEGGLRTYRASRITDAQVTGASFERPPNFDLVEYWADSTAAYERGVPRVRVTVRVPTDRLGPLETAVGRAAVAAADRLPEPEPGWLRLGLNLDWPNDVAARLLAAGPDIEVLEPPDMRSQVAGLAAAVVERYAR